MKNWQLKKEKNIKLQQEKKEKEEIKEVKLTPKINERSIKILKKLKEMQSLTPTNLPKNGLGNKKNSLSPSPSFKPSISERTKILTLNRTTSVFDRLYQPKLLKKEKKSQPALKSKKQIKLENCSFSRNYSINSGRGAVTNLGEITEEVKYERSMKFLLQDLLA